MSIHHPLEFDYILNLYVLSMCFACYSSWIICTIFNAAPMSFFRLKNFLMRISAFPLRPRYICCSTTRSLPSLSKKMLNHPGVLINNPFMTPAINNRNFHSDICDGSCSFLHTPHPYGRGSGSEFVKFSNGPNTNSECSNLLN